MLPGKKLTPEDVITILKKRFWVIVVPWALVAAATAGVSRQLPDLYRSTALIQVIPQQVPQSIVPGLNQIRFEDRLKATEQKILNRTRLERVIQDLNLYQADLKTRTMQEVVEGMRRNIKVLPIKGDAFRVEYTGRHPGDVLKVTELLARYFKDESTLEGERRAEETNTFVESAADLALRRLVEIEDKVKQYQLKYSGQLPAQMGANMQAVNNLQAQLGNVTQALNTDQYNKANLERLIEAAESLVDAVVAAPQVGPEAGLTGTATQKLALAKAALADALTVRRYTQNHPAVRRLNSQIATLTKEAEQEALRAPVGSAIPVSAAEKARLERLATLKADLEQVKKRIETNQEQEKRLRAAAASYQAKIDSVPIRDVELLNLTREYETQKKIHADLVGKREASNLSVNLERRQAGEQFTVIDQARLPERPFSPNRLLINALGLLGGLGVGLGFVALLEYRDNSFKTDYEVTGLLSLPVLAVVPLMRSDIERRAEFRKRLFLNLGLGSTVAVCLAVLAYSFVSLR